MAEEEKDNNSESPSPEPEESVLISGIRSKFPDQVIQAHTALGEDTVVVSQNDLLLVMKFLRDDSAMQFNYLSDLSAVDRLKLGDDVRFAVVYHLYSHKHGHRLRIKIPVEDTDLHIDSVVSIWPAANWLEREVYDMYGIIFNHHPDLRRLLMPDDFESFPLRKDYPLHGKGERDNFVF